MAANVHILPSGRNYISEGKSSLLEAGLRAGLALGYGCSNGNCGQCIARIVSGDVQKIQHHDFCISEHQKASGHILMCCHAAAGDVVIEAPEASHAGQIPRQQITARVKRVNVVNDNVALVHLKTPRTKRLRFLAGQHVQLGGNGIPRASQSIGSCPCDDMNLHFQIPMLRGDRFSEYVFNEMNRGDLVNIDGPGGNFVLDEKSRRSLVFIAWQTGFSPIRSLIEHAMALEVAESTHLAWVATNQQDRYLDNLCRSWDDAFDDFTYVPVDLGAYDMATAAGRLLFGQESLPVKNLADYDFYIAANSQLSEYFKNYLVKNGLPSDQLKINQIDHA